MNKRLPLLAFATFFAASSAVAAPVIPPFVENIGTFSNPTWVTNWVFNAVGIDALMEPQLQVPVEGASRVWVDWTQDSTKVRIYLTQNGNNMWSGNLPANHAGNAEFNVCAVDAEGAEASPQWHEYDIAENTTNTKGLTNQRYPNITRWPATLPTNGKLDNDWMGRNFDERPEDQAVRLLGSNNTAVPTINGSTAGGFVLTLQPVADGVGTIWLKAKMANRNRTEGGTLCIERCTRSSITQMAEIEVPAPTGRYEWHQFRVVLQAANPSPTDVGYFRIRNTTLAESGSGTHKKAVAIDVEDIVLTPLIPDVAITKAELDYSPGYPSVQDPINFTIAVSNCYPAAPATHITPRLLWRQNAEDDFTETVLTNVLGRTEQGEGVYACTLGKDDVEAGPFEYFYEVSFAGYTPTFPAVKYPTFEGLNNVVNGRFALGRIPFLIHTNALALLTDEHGNIHESRSPALCPDFLQEFQRTSVPDYYSYGRSFDVAPDSAAAEFAWGFENRFDLREMNAGWPVTEANYLARPSKEQVVYDPGTIDIPGTYKLLGFRAEDGIRRFRSQYTHMAAVPRPYDAANPGFRIDAGTVPGLDDSYTMQLVGDYTWQAIIHQTNEIDSVFAVTGALHSAGGMTEYQHGATNGMENSPYFWLEHDQEETSINPPSAGNVDRFYSEPVAHEREVVYYEETLVTNATESSAVDLLESVYPPESVRGIPRRWATVTDGGSSTNWHDIVPAWMRARPMRVEGVIMEGVSGDGADFFYTQYATVWSEYNEDGTLLRVHTNAWSSGAWAPVVETVGGEPVTNWFPAQIPATWLKVNWRDDSQPGDLFPTYTLTGLDTNGWDFSALTWTTNEWDDPMTFVDVALESETDETAGWAQIKAEESALASSTVSLAEDATYVESVELGVHREERTKTETYYTYRPDPDSRPDLGSFAPDRLGTRVQIDYDGFLMYRFCTTNGEYQVRRAAWQDFNDWAADINWFSRSFGLYDMQTFECDLEGRDPTAFESMNATGFEEMNGLAADHTVRKNGPEFWDVFVAENAWVIDDRVKRDGTADLKNFNKSVRLSPFSDTPGTLETTGGAQTDGRGIWTMKVRSSADDRISATYKHGTTWTNCFLAVQIQPTAVSDAQGAYASVLFRYNNPRNYAEARLVQKGGYRTVGGKAGTYCQWLEVEVWQTVNGVTTQLNPKQANGTSDFSNYQSYQTNIANENGSKNYFRYPYEYKDAEKGDTYTLKQGHNWTLGVVLDGQLVEVYLWDAKLDSATASNKENPLRHPACFQLHSSLKKGTFGFDVYDVAATFRPWAFPLSKRPEGDGHYPKGTGNSYPYYLEKPSGSHYAASAFEAVATDDAPAENYQQNTQESKDWVEPWGPFAGATGTLSPGITRGIPTAYYRLRIYRTGEENFRDPRAPVPTLNDDWTNRWDFVNSSASDRIVSVQSYEWRKESLPMSLWDDTYVQIQALPYANESAGIDYESNLGAVVVDEFSCDEWRGKTVYDPMLFGNNAEQRMAVESWIGTYAAIVADGRTGRKWELAISRANPDEPQTVTTPLMEHGVGDIMFSYQVVNGPVTFVVELVDEDDGSIATIGSLTAEPSDQTASFYAPGLKTTTGRLRVRTIPPGRTYQDENELTQTSGSDVKGVLYVDNLIAHDYPNDADTSWEAYNMLISSFITPADSPLRSSLSWRKELKFDGRSKQFDSYRSAVFNDATDHETLLDHVLDEHEPFLQTPSIATGIGEVSFWYRAAPGNTEPGKIRLMVANSSLEEDARWVQLTTNDLNATTGRIERECEAMESITSITNETWTYFSAEFFQGDYRMLRLYTGTNDNARVLIDNVLITEPVRASIDVGSVEFLPGVPLCTTNTGARVKLVNPRKNPGDIRVFIDWYVAPGTPRPIDIETRSIEYETIQEPHYLPVTVDGVKYTATYYITKTVAYTNDMVSRTILPPNLKWGYDNWPSNSVVVDPQRNEFTVRGSGSIELFTNATEGRYTFVATNDLIPTMDLPADALVQYSVRVLYRGDFGEPILSEKQGRTHNGFWFENPSWYEPIDLNAYLGTETKPVAHFWNFTVSTNQAFFNEVKPIQYKSSGWSWAAVVSDEINPDTIETQFIELIGAKEGSIKGWQIEHAGKDPEKKTFSPWAPPKWTNTLAGAVGKPPAFHEAGNATTNKGWGVYLVGGTATETPSDEALFPASMNQALADETDTEQYGNYVFLDAPYGLTLKRSMGAYVDRICWGGDSYQKDVQELVNAGFRYIGFRLHSTMGSAYSLAWRGSRSNDDSADWNPQASLTAGGFNVDQEGALWPLAYDEPEVIPPLIAQPVITAFGLTNGVATITFSVNVTNEVALTKDDYVWQCQYSSALATVGEGTRGNFAVTDPDGIHADADGTPATFTFELALPAGSDANFIRLIATPIAEW